MDWESLSSLFCSEDILVAAEAGYTVTLSTRQAAARNRLAARMGALVWPGFAWRGIWVRREKPAECFAFIGVLLSLTR